MRNARAHKRQWSGPTVHSSTVIGLPNPATLPELQLKFDDQITRDRISKVSVFKISWG